jgi:hypothetical protein
MSGSDAPDLTAVRGAAVLFWLTAAGFGVPAIPVARHLLEHRELPMVFGLFRAYGGPFSERVSPETFAILLGLFFGLCVVETFAGWLLWNGSRAGGVLTFVLLPLDVLFWAGFAVPFPFVAGVVRVGLLVVGWSSLR